MSKALVIKGANFSANKVETITIQEVIPCTGISLSDASYAFTAIGETKTLTATVTPADTTEPIIWMSSDTNCATVTNGVVTCVGVGSATITASCGEHAATCEVAASVTIDANVALSAQNGYAHSGAELSNSRDYVSQASSSKSRMYLDTNVTPTGNKALSGTNSDSNPWNALYPIMIPLNAEKISVSAPSGLKNHVYITLLDSTSQPTYNVPNKGVKGITVATDIKSTMEFDLTEYTGYDSFVITLQTTGADASTITGDVTITFS